MVKQFHYSQYFYYFLNLVFLNLYVFLVTYNLRDTQNILTAIILFSSKKRYLLLVLCDVLFGHIQKRPEFVFEVFVHIRFLLF